MAKFTAAILAAAAGSAAAFAPSPVAKSTLALNAALDGMVGGNSVEPMPFRPGSDNSAKMFDPVGFAEVRIR